MAGHNTQNGQNCCDNRPPLKSTVHKRNTFPCSMTITQSARHGVRRRRPPCAASPSRTMRAGGGGGLQNRHHRGVGSAKQVSLEGSHIRMPSVPPIIIPSEPGGGGTAPLPPSVQCASGLFWLSGPESAGGRCSGPGAARGRNSVRENACGRNSKSSVVGNSSASFQRPQGLDIVSGSLLPSSLLLL